MGITKLALKYAVGRIDLMKYDRYLFLGPRPDDIEIGAGATAARLAGMGKAVRFVVCTDGRFGSDTIGCDELVMIRHEEAVYSARFLGVDDIAFLPFSDGACYLLDDMEKAIASEIASFQPDVIFAPDPFVPNECHQDHLNVGMCARKLACFSPYGGIMKERYSCNPAEVKALAFYMTAHPNTYVKTSSVLLRKQLDAIKLHESQFSAGADVFAYLRLRSADMGIRRFHLHAEGFRAYSQTGMHCLPELG